MHCNVLVRHRDRSKLNRIYKELLEGSEADPDALVVSETSRNFMSKLRIGVMLDGGRRQRQHRSVDVAFLHDVVSRQAKEAWFSVPHARRYPSLLDHVPARWSYRRVTAEDELKATNYLACPRQPPAVGLISTPWRMWCAGNRTGGRACFTGPSNFLSGPAPERNVRRGPWPGGMGGDLRRSARQAPARRARHQCDSLSAPADTRPQHDRVFDFRAAHLARPGATAADGIESWAFRGSSFGPGSTNDRRCVQHFRRHRAARC